MNVDLISRLMNRAGELVLSRNQLRSFMEQTGKGDPRANHIMQNLDMVTSNIQEAIMQMRMQPVIELLGKYKRVVRDIARRMEKKVDLVLAGTGVELDRNILEKLASPLTHIIRNCIDHGIEDPEERERIGKPRTGTIRIETFQQGGHVHMTISDDGAGIDPQLVLSKAFEKGLVTEEQMQDMTERQKVDLVFLPGFSTSREITDISGRGVGMDVVKTNIEQLRGRIEIHTRINRGTAIKLIFPLTLSIVPSLIVSSGEHKFALPRSSIKETIFMEPGKIHEQVVQIAGAEAIRLRNRLTPVLRLRNVLDLPAYTHVPGQERLQQEKRKAIADRRGQKTGQWEGMEQRSKDERRMNPWDATYVILLKVGMDVFGLCVDEIYDIEEVVVEPLNPYIKHLECYAGATILGDGNVIMILDVAGIAAFSELKFEAVRQEETVIQESTPEEGKDNCKSRDLIVFSNADSEYFGIELTRLTRLKSLDPLKIYQVEKDRYIRYDDQAVQLFTMDEILPASPGDLSSGSLFVVFPKSLKSDAGIIASKIVDTVQCDASVFERKKRHWNCFKQDFYQRYDGADTGS